MTKSPFFVIEDAVSPSKCELIAKQLGIRVPSLDEKGKPLKHERLVTGADIGAIIQSAIQPSVAEMEERYDGSITGIETPVFQQFFENPEVPCQPHGCENAKYLRKKWVKHRDVDLVGYLWLKDYNGNVPLDPSFETYGGKLEFAAYNFSLVPQRGTIVFFPAGPHFITAISPILVGSLEQIKITMKLHLPDDAPWIYQPSAYPGTYQEWFSQ
jgi:hypothetical protein